MYYNALKMQFALLKQWLFGNVTECEGREKMEQFSFLLLNLSQFESEPSAISEEPHPQTFYQ